MEGLNFKEFAKFEVFPNVKFEVDSVIKKPCVVSVFISDSPSDSFVEFKRFELVPSDKFTLELKFDKHIFCSLRVSEIPIVL